MHGDDNELVSFTPSRLRGYHTTIVFTDSNDALLHHFNHIPDTFCAPVRRFRRGCLVFNAVASVQLVRNGPDDRKGDVGFLKRRCLKPCRPLRRPRRWRRAWPRRPSQCRHAGSRSHTRSCWRSCRTRWSPGDAPAATHGRH